MLVTSDHEYFTQAFSNRPTKATLFEWHYPTLGLLPNHSGSDNPEARYMYIPSNYMFKYSEIIFDLRCVEQMTMAKSFTVAYV